MDKSRKPPIDLLIGFAKSKDKAEPKEEVNQELETSDEDFETMAEELIVAIKTADAKSLAESLKSFFEACENSEAETEEETE
jgi:hypothetical protein